MQWGVVAMPKLVADGLSYEQVQELKTLKPSPGGGGDSGMTAMQATPSSLFFLEKRKHFWFIFLMVATLTIAATGILGAAMSKSDVWKGYEPSVLETEHSDAAAACAAASDSKASCDIASRRGGRGGSSSPCVWFSNDRGDGGSCGLPRWCEHMRVHALVRTPSNTYSAHFYTLVALYMLLCGVFDRCRAQRHQPPLAANPICKVWWLSALAALANIAHGDESETDKEMKPTKAICFKPHLHAVFPRHK